MPRIPERIKIRAIALAGQIDANITEEPLSSQGAKELIQRLLPLEQAIADSTGLSFGNNMEANLKASQYVISDTFQDARGNFLTLFKVLDKSARRERIEGAHVLPSNFSLPALVVRPEMVDLTDEERHKISVETNEMLDPLFPEGIDFLVIVDNTSFGFEAQEYYCFNRKGQAIRMLDLTRLTPQEIAEDYPDESSQATHIQLSGDAVLSLPQHISFPITDNDLTYVEGILQEIGTRWTRVEQE
jgi:hypothetical protein